MESNGFNLDALIDAVAERLAVKVAERTQNSATIKPRLLTVEQAAIYLGRTKEAVQHMIFEGKVPTVRTDRRVFIDIRDLDAWIEDNKQGGII